MQGMPQFCDFNNFLDFNFLLYQFKMEENVVDCDKSIRFKEPNVFLKEWFTFHCYIQLNAQC